MIKKLGLHYQGSKLQQINNLLEYRPEFNRGLDLFGGTAVVALNFGLEYNDSNPYVVRVMTEAKQEILDQYIAKYKVLEDIEVKMTGSRKFLKMNYNHWCRFIDDFDLESDDIYMYYMFKQLKHPMTDNRECFYRNRGYLSLSTFQDIAKKQKLWHDNIKAWYNKDFRDIDFNEYDFIFIDPPYLSSKMLYQGWTVEDETDLLNKLRTYNGKFIITNMLNEPLNNLIDELKLKVYDMKIKRSSEYGAIGGVAKKPKEFIIVRE